MENSKFKVFENSENNNNGYINLIFTLALPNEAAESLCDKLLDFGAISATIEDADAGTDKEIPQFGEPGMQNPDEPLNLWKNSKISSLWAEEDFDISKTENKIVKYLKKLKNLKSTENFKKNIDFLVENVAEQNWVELTQSQFEPIEISQNLIIVPTWHQQNINNKDNADKSIQIILDPGMAFGTGSHPTTHLCLNFLEKIFHEKSTKISDNFNVLDYGCGSGILGIAAAKFGTKNVVGVDIDKNAVKAAKFNAEQNSVTTQMQIFSVDEFSQNSQSKKFDVVVANILANPLRLLAPMLVDFVKNDGGRIALSGILSSQIDEIIAIYSPYISLKIFAERDGWACLYGAK